MSENHSSNQKGTASRRQITLKRRMLNVALIGTLPLAAIAVVLLHNSVNHNIAFGAQELRGNAFQQPLEQLLDLLPRYQAALGGDTVAGTTADLSSRIEDTMRVLSENYNGKLGSALKFTDEELAARKRENARLGLVRQDWSQLKSMAPAMGATNEANARLAIAVRSMITHAGDLSNLILDSDLDSYYLMDITLCTLPQTQQRLGDAIIQVGGWLRQGQAVSNRVQIAVISAMLRQDDVDRIVTDAQTSIAEDKNNYGVSASLQANLPPAVEKYRQSSQAFIELLDQIVAGRSVSLSEFQTAGWKARGQAFELWNAGVEELDRLLELRLASLRQVQWMYFCVIIFALMAVGGIIWHNVRRLNGQFAVLIETLGGSADQLVSAASQVTDSSQGLAQGVSEQAASIQETSASLE